MTNRTQMYNVENWIGEVLTFLKASEAITGKKFLLKYQKQVITSALNRGDAHICIYTKCSPLLSAGSLYWSRIKFLPGNFTGVPITNFLPYSESKIVNQPGL